MKLLVIFVFLSFQSLSWAENCPPGTSALDFDQNNLIENSEKVVVGLVSTKFNKCRADIVNPDVDIDLDKAILSWSKKIPTKLTPEYKKRMSDFLIKGLKNHGYNNNCKSKIKFKEQFLDIRREYKQGIKTVDLTEELKDKIHRAEYFEKNYGQICEGLDKTHWRDRSKKLWETESQIIRPCTMSFEVSYQDNDFSDPKYKASKLEKLNECIDATIRKSKANGVKISLSKIKTKGYSSGLANTKQIKKYDDISFIESELNTINNDAPLSYRELSKLRAAWFGEKILKNKIKHKFTVDALGMGMLGECPYDENGKRNSEYSGTNAEKLDKYRKVIVSAEFKVDKKIKNKKLSFYRKGVNCISPKFVCGN